MDKNFLRDIQSLFVMNSGEEFLDYLNFRNERIRDIKAKLKKQNEPKEEEKEVVEPKEHQKKKNQASAGIVLDMRFKNKFRFKAKNFKNFKK